MLNTKKIIAFISLLPFISLSISITAAEYATKNYFNNNNSYKEAIINPEIEFQAERDGHLVKMNWSEYKNDDFMYYKIMRSETHSNPIYPNQPAIKFFDNSKSNELKIGNYSNKEAFYRVCIITTEKARFCSKVVKVEGFNKEIYKKEYEEKKVEKKQDVKNIKSRLSYKMQNKANLAASKFIKRIESKYNSNEERIEKFEKVINKLKDLKNKNKKYEDLVNHLNMKFKEKIESYEEDFNEIDKIFNEIN